MITVFFRKNEPDKKLADMEREREEILHLLSALACKLHAERRRDFVQADVINNTVTSTTMMNLAMGNRPLSRGSSVQGNIGYGGGGGGAGSAGGGGGGELDGFNTNEEDSDLRAYDEEGRLISREKLVHTWDRLKNWVDQGKFSPLIVLNGKYRFSHLSLQEYLVAHSWAGSKHLSDIRCYENVFFRGRILTFNDKRLRDLVIDPWYRETFLLCAGAMEQSDFIKFATFLQRLYRKQGGLIDSTVYNMINERPPEERDFYKDLERGLNSERKLKVILDGVVHESMDMREMALSRIKLYKNYDKISKELVKRLGDKESYAAQAISLIIPKGNSSTVRRLLDKCCVDKDSKIRAQACFCLGNIAERDDRDVISMLVSLCNDPDQKVVERSIEALSKVAESTGNEQAVNKLIEKLEVMGTRSIAATALGCVAVSNDARVMDILISNAKQFEAAAVALGQVAKRGDQKILNLLIDCLEENGHDEHNITHAISQVADKNHSRQVTDKLIGMLRHKRHTAYRAATALGSVVRTGDKRVINQLIDMMKERACVDKAIVALGYVSDRENALVTDKLLEALGERGASHIVREQAALSLSKVCKKGDHRVIKKLCERLGDVEEVVNAAAAALEKISQKDNVEVIKAFLDLMLHPDTGVVERSVQILGRICTRGQNNEAKHALLKMLQSGTSQSQTLRGMCADALAQVAEFDDENVIQVLVNIVKQSGEDRPSPHLRCCCLTALGILISNRRSPVAFELFEMLHGREQDKEVERECIALLAKICDVGRFVEFLKMRNYRDDRATIFSIVVMAIRFLRGQNPNWKLDQSQIDVLERNKCLESTFILLENAG
ncbi:gcn1 [Acrasis kona]|uniref:Gcn1 n=1 Tax=Acrasis kona TaxID=1008807 RepID=A0AAW2YV81_9EUKA